MLISCWSAKGGSGTTVVSAALALLLSRSSPGGALLVDLGGDIPAALGVPDAPGPGLTGWLDAGTDVPSDALARLQQRAAPSLSMLPRGAGPLRHPDRAEILAGLLAAERRPVVVDCGLVATDQGEAGDVAAVLAAAATHSLLVIRPCYLALRRALAAPVRPSGVVLLTEPGRALGADDIEDVLKVEVRAVLALDRDVFRAVDAGLLATRLPRVLERGLRDAA